LLSGSIRYESLIDLPAVGIAGAPNAGKSSLLNALLGQQRSLVSDQRQTTRDVLSGVLKTDRLECVLFDCAGLLAAPDNVLDELAQQAAIEALRHCQLVLFCVDMAKADFTEDVAIRALVDGPDVFYVATKCDLVDANSRAGKLAGLERTFGGRFLPVSSATGEALDGLRGRIERELAEVQSGARPAGTAGEGRDTIALTARHRQAVSDAIESVSQAMAEVEAGSDEVAAALMRTACQALADIETEPIDEQLLDRIFGRFCIGK
jgi:tRNA modification GTPase